jgi:hypothetical protein
MRTLFPYTTLFRSKEFISAIELQHFIVNEESQGGFNVPLEEIKSLLMIMKLAGFLDELNEIYTYTKKEYVKKEIVGATFDTATNPLWDLKIGDMV